MKKYIYIFIVIVVSFSVSSCNKNDKNDKLTTELNADTTTFNEAKFFAKIDQSKLVQINSIIEGFISPVEMSASIKDNHIEFSKEYLIPTSLSKNYETKIKQALAFGFYSTDLGYLNIYNKTSQMVNYLVTVNNLAGELRVAQFFDFSTLKKLVTQNNNMDSLLFLTTSSFHQIDNYFTHNNQSYLTVMMISGAWIESQYLLTRVAKNYPDKDFKTKVGSQKDILLRLFEIIKIYKGDPQFDYLINQYKKLVLAYDPVSVKTIETQGHIEYKDGNPIIYPNEETVVEISDSTLNNIINVSQNVRNAILKIQ